MSWFKDLTRSAAAQEAVNGLVAGFCRLVRATATVTVVHPEKRDAAFAVAEGRVIYTVWHQRLPMFWAAPGIDRRRIHCLASAHRDGRLIARAMERLGMKTISGSTSKGGAQALREMIRTLKRGDKIGITPDGPRGPRMVAQNGALALAQVTGAPILPVGISASRVWLLGSWDRMQMILPFSRIVYVFGEPFVVPRDAEDLEPHRRAFEAALTAVTDEADRLVGQPPTEPEREKAGS